jgi:hypothetical protein
MPIFCLAGPHTSVDQWDKPRLYHEPFDSKFAKKIAISRSYWPSKLLKHNYSKNSVYWYGVIMPDTTKEAPWTTKIFIYNERKNPIQIDLLEHNNYPVKVYWVNEKLLFIEVWWGRIVGTDIIYDVEKEAVIYREMIKDGRYLYKE